MNLFLASGIILLVFLSLALYELQFTYHDLVNSLLYNVYFQGFVLIAVVTVEWLFIEAYERGMER
jgi:hypothetical protein